MTNDPRLNLPSASSFALDALCPGRQALLAKVGDVPEVVDEDAARGTKLHAAWEKDSPAGLIGEDVELFEQGQKLVQSAYMQWVMQFNLTDAREGLREHRFWLHDERGNLAASGQADRHWFAGTHGLLLDYKSLYVTSLAPAELNWQLLFLAVCCAREYDLQHVRCVFAKPMFKQLDIVDYTADDLERAQYAIQQVLWASHHLLERRAGPHCRHCKAVTACPEATAYCLLPSVKARALEGVTPKTAGVIADSITLEDCVKIWETQTSRRNIEDAIKARLKGQSPEVLKSFGIEFGKAKINRTITDAKSAFEFLVMASVPVDKIWSALRFSNEELASVVHTSLGQTSAKAAVEWVRTKLKPFIEEKEQEKPLVKI